MRSVLATAVGVALALMVSGCGGADDDAEASRAISASIVKQQRSTGGPGGLLSLQRKEATCIGDGLVKRIGVDRLRKQGMLTDDNKVKGSVTNARLSEADARKATSVLFDCADVEAMVEKGLARSGKISRQMLPCVNRVLDEKSLRSMFIDFFQGDQNAPQALAAPMLRCIRAKAR
jgi:Flp pilus assembly protein TadD